MAARVLVGLWLVARLGSANQVADAAGGPADPPDPAVTSDATSDATSDWPIGGALGARIYCIEGKESTHGLHMYNPSSGASGWLQWLPATARRWSVTIGDRQSEWFGAARIAARGNAFFTSQWVPLQRGLC